MLVKPDLYSKSKSLFKGTDIEIVTDGAEYLGGAIGSNQYVSSILSKKTQKWLGETDSLAVIATTEPHVAFAAFTHGISASWQSFSRVTDISSATIDKQFLHE